MKKILVSLVGISFSFQVFAADITNYIYTKAMMGDVNGLKNLASKGYSLDTKDDDGNTAYCLAVFRRNQTAVNTLEQAGADLYPRCLKSVAVVTEAMIYKAAHNQDVEQITFWQKHGIPIDLLNNRDGNTALCQAVYEKDCEAIDILLKAGASEYHDCMRRVPQKVRQELDCKPVVIDWERVGLTVLGAGLVAGGVAVALSGGGGSSGESCAINQHWDGEKCVSCSSLQCWDGNTCRVAYQGEYIDPVTNRCFQIAPPPYKEGTYKPVDFETKEYKRGGFLQDINASSAYARGYTGYMISRTDIFGKLENGQSSIKGAAGDITPYSPVVGVLSTGTEIENTPEKDESGTIKKDDKGNTIYARYVNKDLAYEILKEKTTVEKLDDEWRLVTTGYEPTGKWGGNLYTSSTGKLSGYNFDYGYIKYQSKAESAEKYSGSQEWEYKEGKFIVKRQGDLFDGASAKNSYYSGSIHYFTESGDKDNVYLVLHGGDCTSASGYCGIAAIGYSEEAPLNTHSYKLVDLKECGSSYTCLQPPSDINSYVYTSGYTYDLLKPAPHYNIDKNKGTFLAGIIAALKNENLIPDHTDNMHGVAYNAFVLPAVADIFRPITEKSIKTLVDSGASIILQDIAFPSAEGAATASYVYGKTLKGVFGEDATEGYSYAANKGTVLLVGTGSQGNNVITAGKVDYATDAKDYQKDAGISAGVALASDASALSDLFLSVTSVQKDTSASGYGGYVLTPYSQPCGSTAKYCLSAPGGSAENPLYSTISTDAADPEFKWGESYGTSAAAAVVAGSIAVLRGAYPHLTSQEIVRLLEQTATPLGACAGGASDIDECKYATDSSGSVIGQYSTLYGWGLVNLDAATKPVGPLWVNNGNSTWVNPYIGVYSISGSGLSTSSVMSQSLMSALPTTFSAFDSYDRPFAVNTKALLSTRSTRKEFDDDFKAFMHGRDVKKVKANDQFSMTYAPRTSDRSSVMKTGLMEMDMDLGKANLGFYYTEDTLNSRGNYFERSLNNPFVQIQEAYGAEAKYNLTSKFSVGMSYATGKNGFLGDGDKHYKAPENSISFISSDFTYKPIKSVMFKASYGVMKEQDSVLGMMGTGAFKTAGADTTFVSAGVEIKPTDKFKLNLAYTYGWTTPDRTNGLMNLSRLTAEGFSAVAQYDLGSENMLGLSVSSPLRIRSGRVSFDLPVGRSATDDTVYRKTFTGSMKPTARELDFALFYRDALTDALTVQSELGVRLNPDHQKEASPDYRAMFGLKWDY